MFRDLFTRLWSPRRLRAQGWRRPIALEPLEDRVVPALADLGSLAVDSAHFDQEHILVRLRPDVANLNTVALPQGVKFESAVGLVPGLWEVRLDQGATVQQALAAFKNSPGVLDASPNYFLSISQTPNDTRFGEMWNLNNTGQTAGTPDADIDAPAAWDITIGSPGVVVAVIDTGVDYSHPDLAANMWTNDAEANGVAGQDDDGNGFVDDIHGYDFANNDGNPMDDNGHGTHVAGTIGAVGNNNLGVIGVAPGVRLMAVKFLDSSGNGTVSNAIRALNYAVQMGASVSNNSYGGNSAEDSSPLFLEAIQNAAAAGHIVVAGAGNDGTNNDQGGFFPATFDADNVISVAATDHNDRLASFSNYGPTTVDLAAPGVDILSTLPNGSYGTNSGTSMATPHVTGVVALVQSQHPDWSYQQVIERVLGSVDYLPGLENRVATAGRLNAARALLDSDGPRVVGTSPAGGVGGAVSSMRVSFNESIDPSTFTAADIVSFTGPNGAISVTGVSAVAGSSNRKFDISFATQTARGDYSLVLGPNIADASGNLMDQDGDGTFGEATQDQYTADFNIGNQYVFTATDTPRPFSLFGGAGTSTITVTDDLSIADLNVRVSVSSGDVGFLGINLVGPNGTRVALAPVTATPAGPEYRNTVFDDEASTPITGGASPFEGSFRPSGDLSVFDGLSTQGTWKLEVSSVFDGTIDAFSLLVVANQPALSAADLSLNEGDSGTTQATFTVRLAHVTDVPVTVNYATADGTATAGSDYDAASGTLTFAPGELTKAVLVNVRGDTADEPDETFFLNLSNASGARLLDTQAVATIKNDEVRVSVSDANLAEGNLGSTNAVFTVTLSQASTHAVTVQYATAPGTATAGTDFVTATGSLTFNPGETSKNVVVAVKGDARFEGNETFFVNATATGAAVADGQAVGTITNDDPVPVVSVNDVTITEGNGGTKSLYFTVNLTGPSDTPVTVNYATADGTATAGSDYTATSGTLTFAPGQTSRSVQVTLSGDTDAEASEAFLFNLSGATGAILLDGQAQATVLNDDVSVSINDVTVTEGDSGSFAATFTVSLSGALPADVTVNYATASGTASAASDFVGASGTLTIAAGQTSTTVTVRGIADRRDEPDETFFVNLSGAVNAAIADAQGQATITDDDAPPSISMTSSVSTAEGNAGTKAVTFTFTLSRPSGQPVTFTYSTADGTATAGQDYQAKSGTLTFNPGATVLTLTVNVNGDKANEGDEAFALSISNPINATIAAGQGTATIVDDEALPAGAVSMQAAGTNWSASDRALLSFLQEARGNGHWAALERVRDLLFTSDVVQALQRLNSPWWR